MARSKEYQKGEKAGRKAGREEGRKECLDFLRNEDAELSRKLERWLQDQKNGEPVIKEQEEDKIQELGEQGEVGNQESNGHQSIASRLPPEVLSMTFSHLDSHRLVLIKRVSSQWYETIDTNASFFKVLNLPLKSIRNWDNLILEYFTRKSHKQLEQVSLPTQPMIEENDAQRFIGLLSLSASTLRSLSCAFEVQRVDIPTSLLSDTFYNLQCLSISFPNSIPRSSNAPTRLATVFSSTSPNPQHLRHLVLDGIFFNQSGNYIMDMVFGQERPLKVEYLRIFAEAASPAPEAGQYGLGSVKILVIVPGYQSTLKILSRLHCPKIKLLILDCSDSVFLDGHWSWPMEELWLSLRDGIENNCSVSDLEVLYLAPKLRNLRIDSGEFPFRQHLLAEVLEKRFDNVQARRKVNGLRMVFLEKLIISKKHFGKKVVARLEKVVGEVIDSKDVPDKIEIDLSESDETQRDYL